MEEEGEDIGGNRSGFIPGKELGDEERSGCLACSDGDGGGAGTGGIFGGAGLGFAVGRVLEVVTLERSFCPSDLGVKEGTEMEVCGDMGLTDCRIVVGNASAAPHSETAPIISKLAA